jgi:hypothetical protein
LTLSNNFSSREIAVLTPGIIHLMHFLIILCKQFIPLSILVGGGGSFDGPDNLPGHCVDPH